MASVELGRGAMGTVIAGSAMADVAAEGWQVAALELEEVGTQEEPSGGSVCSVETWEGEKKGPVVEEGQAVKVVVVVVVVVVAMGWVVVAEV
mmetsp:Transcript_31824/g.83180  ORF Transcript_31824/g.83180 Transcript_31824/m.83180 type:complete len:92 (+) Transcript_31824:319-594(+)